MRRVEWQSRNHPCVTQSTCMCWLAQSCQTLSDPMDCSPPGMDIGVSCHFLLQGIFQSNQVTEPMSPALAGGFPNPKPPGNHYKHQICNSWDFVLLSCTLMLMLAQGRQKPGWWIKWLPLIQTMARHYLFPYGLCKGRLEVGSPSL